LCRAASAAVTNTFIRRKKLLLRDAIFEPELVEQPALIPPLAVLGH